MTKFFFLNAQNVLLLQMPNSVSTSYNGKLWHYCDKSKVSQMFVLLITKTILIKVGFYPSIHFNYCKFKLNQNWIMPVSSNGAFYKTTSFLPDCFLSLHSSNKTRRLRWFRNPKWFPPRPTRLLVQNTYFLSLPQIGFCMPVSCKCQPNIPNIKGTFLTYPGWLGANV